VTSRTPEGRDLAQQLGAHQTFNSGEALPRRVDAVMDSVGQATWPHTLQSVRRGGTVVTVGITSGNDAGANLLRLFVEQITVTGSIMGTLEEMNNLIRLVISAGIKPQIGELMPMERAADGFRAMWEDQTQGKIVFTR
jgi:D-arabinose 1-dehydrogenase-like Zn-dependent alcohol dehydrogenase